jgi:hypothetical protein
VRHFAEGREIFWWPLSAVFSVRSRNLIAQSSYCVKFGILVRLYEKRNLLLGIWQLSCGLEGPGFESLQGQDVYLFSKRRRPALKSTQRPTQ